HGELWQLEPEIRRRELKASAVRVLQAKAADRQVVVLFDDADLYDAPSRDFLRYLSSGDLAHSLRVVIATSGADADSWPESDRTARIELTLFGDDHFAQIADHLDSSGHEGMPDAVVLAARTDHSPSHVEHLVRFVVEGGSVEDALSSLADLVAERVKLLPHHALVAAQITAVYGMEVERDFLSLLLSEHSSVSVPVDEPLSILRARGLFSVGSGTRVGFCQQLVRDVVYDSTPADVRRELHARALRTLVGTVSDPLILGHHHEMAGDLQKAATLLMHAGDDAAHQLDGYGATELYRRAQASARTLMLKDADSEQRSLFVSLSVKLAETLRMIGQSALARGVVEEARYYCDGAPKLTAQIQRASALLLADEGNFGQAIEVLRQAIGMLITTGDMELTAEFYLDLAAIHERNRDIVVAIDELVEGIDLVTLGEGESATGGPQVMWRLLLRQASLQNELERFKRALELAESALLHARRVRSRIGSARVQSLLATCYEKLGNHERAEQYREAAIRELRRLGDRRGTAELLLAWVNPARTMWPINPEYLREAKELAGEVGWSEGVRRALEESR
ncbi:MAG: hypothetical protein AAGC55_14850, partial [Myxococcota bacterium]